jgi:hypothetical protein
MMPSMIQFGSSLQVVGPLLGLSESTGDGLSLGTELGIALGASEMTDGDKERDGKSDGALEGTVDGTISENLEPPHAQQASPADLPSSW